MPQHLTIMAGPAPVHGVAVAALCLAVSITPWTGRTIDGTASHADLVRQVVAPGDPEAGALEAVPGIAMDTRPASLLLLLCGVILLVLSITYLGSRLTGRAVRPPPEPRTRTDETTPDVTMPDEIEAAGSPHEADDLTGGVSRTLGRLEEALERQRRFSSDASHELRTPLTAMRAQIEDALHAPHETDVVTLAMALLPSLDRLQRIATDLLTLSRLESEALPVRPQRVDLGKLAEGELQMTPTTKRMVRRMNPDVVVLGDPHALGSLISNLLGNAQRHAASTVTVSVRREPHGANGSAQATAVLEVADDGPGIPREQRENVFQRFTRLDSARSRDAGGAGLGLPIARQIAENHGGRLTIEDSAEGARFVLRLPIAPDAEP